MRSMIKNPLSIFFLITVALAGWDSRGALREPHQTNSQKKMAEQVQKIQSDVEIKDDKARSVISVLYQVQLKIKEIVRKKSQLISEKNQQMEALEKTKAQIQELSQQIEIQKKLLGRRIQTSHQIQGSQLFQMILGVQNPQKMNKAFRILALSSSHDVEQLKSFDQNIKSLDSQKRISLNKVQSLVQIEKKLTDEENHFLKELQVRKNFLDKIQLQKSALLQKIKDLKLTAQGLTLDESGVLDPLLRPSFIDQKGLLSWPVEGPVISFFGPESRENHHLKLYNKGIFIETSGVLPVKSVYDGQVVFVGSLDGISQSVIIDHGDHFYTIYSQVNKIFVSINEYVVKNQKIASTGLASYIDKSNAKAQGLYFEIRHFTEPYDPTTWMKGMQL